MSGLTIPSSTSLSHHSNKGPVQLDTSNPDGSNPSTPLSEKIQEDSKPELLRSLPISNLDAAALMLANQQADQEKQDPSIGSVFNQKLTLETKSFSGSQSPLRHAREFDLSGEEEAASTSNSETAFVFAYPEPGSDSSFSSEYDYGVLPPSPNPLKAPLSSPFHPKPTWDFSRWDQGSITKKDVPEA